MISTISDQDIHNVVMQLINGTYSHGDTMMFRDLYNSLLTAQGGEQSRYVLHSEGLQFLCGAQKRRRSYEEEAYRDKDSWAKNGTSEYCMLRQILHLTEQFRSM